MLMIQLSNPMLEFNLKAAKSLIFEMIHISKFL